MLPTIRPITEAVSALADSGVEARGAVFTRREVVDFILDLIGYVPEQPLFNQRLLEPAFGEGDFLLPVVERLLKSWTLTNSARSSAIDHLRNSLRAVELHTATFEDTKAKVIRLLEASKISTEQALILANEWLIKGDFLLAPLPEPFDFVAGNPPYLRQESIPQELISEYRERYETIYDRADLYIPFIERSLKSLTQGGQLGFICADRWMKNRYGGPLRGFVAEQFHLKVYVDMVNTPAFKKDVIAYPAITVIKREPPGPTRIAWQPKIDPDSLACLSSLLVAPDLPESDLVQEILAVGPSSEPWILASPSQMGLVRRLESQFPTLEEAKCKVGIGVATGADKAFIGNFEELDVEPDRKLPLVMTRDIQRGVVDWRGLGVINPFGADGTLVNLQNFPKLGRYLDERKTEISRRHVAQKTPTGWYRTIDRIYPDLAKRPKLLIPDIKGAAHVVYEEGRLYPHHNLYFVVSEEWDLKALQAVLMSELSRLFVSLYSTKMRGGYLRFQAQYLRRIRIPYWSNVSNTIRQALINAAEQQDLLACNLATYELYSLTEDERNALGTNGDTNVT